MDDQTIVDVIELDLGGGKRKVYEIKRPKFANGVECKPSHIVMDLSLDPKGRVVIDGSWNGETIHCVTDNSVE